MVLYSYIFDEKKHYSIDELKELMGYSLQTRTSTIKDKLIGSGLISISDVIRRRCKLRGHARMNYHYFIEAEKTYRLLMALGLTQGEIEKAMPDYALPNKTAQTPEEAILKDIQGGNDEVNQGEADENESQTIRGTKAIFEEEEEAEDELTDWERKFKALSAEYDTLVQKSKEAITFMSAVQCSEDSITISTLNAILRQNGINIGQKRLFDWFRTEGYIRDSEDGYEKNIPTEKAIDSGYFTVREVVVNGSGSKPHLTFTPKITGKGQVHFVNLFSVTEDIGEV